MAKNTTPHGRVSKRQLWGGATALLVAGGAAGAILAGSMSASAATAPTPSTTQSSTTTPPKDTSPTSVRSGEALVTDATKLATLKAAALAAVPGGTIVRVETDADGDAYEAHMTKADGTQVTVKFDTNLAVTSVQDGMGAGGPQGNGGHGPRGQGGQVPPTATE